MDGVAARLPFRAVAFHAALHFLRLIIDGFPMFDRVLLEYLLTDVTAEGFATKCPTADVHCPRPVHYQPLLRPVVILIPQPFGPVAAMSLTSQTRRAVRPANLCEYAEVVGILDLIRLLVLEFHHQ